jgi:hypothetical protein
MDEPNYIRQLGNGKVCARRDCVNAPQYRVILGRFRIQVYVCSPHTLWGIELNALSEETGKAMGWEYGYGSTPYFRTIHEPKIVSLAVKEIDYRRDESVNIGSAFPTPEGKWF